jgi:Cft2 family RNA processing exonuclease
VPNQLTPLGKMTAFYIPAHKLDAPSRGAIAPRATIHEFLIEHFRAYTHAPSLVKGFWLDAAGHMLHDVLERFEVSFDAEADFERLVDFLRRTCDDLGEEAIYLTRGEKSFLVNK